MMVMMSQGCSRAEGEQLTPAQDRSSMARQPWHGVEAYEYEFRRRPDYLPAYYCNDKCNP